MPSADAADVGVPQRGSAIEPHAAFPWWAMPNAPGMAPDGAGRVSGGGSSRFRERSALSLLGWVCNHRQLSANTAENPMELESLRALYVDELKDLYNAEGQILKAMPRMIKAASNRQLKQALTEHERVTRKQVQRLERIFKDLDETPRGKKCHGMEGLLKEGKELIAEKPEPEVLDAGLISKAQHVEHYEIAGYGTVRSWAQQLGFDQHVELLQETLDEEAEADKRLSALAESSINIEADESDEESSSDREVAVATSRETGSRGRRTRTSARRGRSEAGAM